MSPRNLLVCLFLCLLVVAMPALAEGDKKSDESKAEESSKKSDDKASKEGPVVLTNEDLAKKEGDEPLVFTNDYLRKKFGDPEPETPAAGTPAEGGEKTGEASGEAKQGEAAEAEGKAAEEELTPEQRAQRISEIQTEIERLNKRLLSIRNPLLAGVNPATEEERAEQAGKDNRERLQMTQDKIAKLEAELAELQGQN